MYFDSDASRDIRDFLNFLTDWPIVKKWEYIKYIHIT